MIRSKPPGEWLPSVLFAVLLYLVLLIRFGYVFGVNDQVELMPYVLYLQNPELYPHDFFLQSMEAIVPHERTFTVYFLTLFSGFLQPAAFILHGLCVFFFILGLERLARMFINNKYWAWVVIFITLYLLHDFDLAGVELYYIYLVPTSLSKAIAVWALVYFFKRRLLWSSLLLVVATLFQPVIAIDLMIVLSLLTMYDTLQAKQFNWRQVASFMGIYGCTAGIYLLWMYTARNSGYEGITNQEYFDIIFAFRHPHHYIFNSFPASERWGFFLLMAAAIPVFYKRNQQLFLFMVFSLVIMMFYIVMVDYFNVVFVTNFQWYKMFLWLKFLGIVGVFAWIEDRFSVIEKLRLPSRMETTAMMLMIVAGIVLLAGFRQYIPFRVVHYFGDQVEKIGYLNFTAQIKEHTPVDAVFIQPAHDSSLKYYGQRSSFVELKAVVKDKKFSAEWHRRLQLVYDIHKDMRLTSSQLARLANEHFYKLDSTSLQPLKAEGVTHILTKKDHELPGMEIVLENNHFKVVKLQTNSLHNTVD